MVDRPVTLVALVPELHGGVGHVLGYQLSVARAAAINGWRYVALCAKDHGLAQLPDGWRPVLAPGTLVAGVPDALRKGHLFHLFADLERYARSVRDELGALLERSEGRCILFMEDFNGPQLVAIGRALARLPAQRLHFWLMFRHDPAGSGFVGRAYVAAARRLAARLPAGHMQVLADSEPLAGAVSAALRLPVRVMPIPHTHVAPATPFPRHPGEIICWWPGAPRPEKGLEAIRALASLPPQQSAGAVRLVVSESADLTEGGALRVQRVAARLTEEEYDRWLVTSDVILLPYEAARYRYSTSGIFAECVAAGGIPLVTPGTWMATELEKHSLSELVIGWNDPRRVLETITTLARDLRVRQKLDRMRERFADFHSEAGYAATMRELVPAEMGR